jgi:hypothetical protein
MYLKYDVKKYFNAIKALDSTKVLDFGCNHANFLNEKFTGEYIGLDIDSRIIKNNKKTYPQHQWIHYNKYNYQYNCEYSTTDDWPDIPTGIETAVAFSVFTHTTFDEFSYTTNKLKSHIAPGGDILATFFSSINRDSIYKILSHRQEYFSGHENYIVEKISNKDVVYLCVNTVSNQILIFDNIKDLPKFSNHMYFLTFYNDEWLSTKLQGHVVDVTDNFTNIMSTQKCLRLSITR